MYNEIAGKLNNRYIHSVLIRMSYSEASCKDEFAVDGKFLIV